VSGLTSYLAGQAAEFGVQRHYQNLGYQIESIRWRGTAGEIDLIFRRDGAVIFVEVKKSANFQRASERVSPAQLQRIHATACEFLENEPQGQMTPCRFDVALVNAQGEIDLLENVLAY
jgi:putative endonuclease